MKWFKKSLDIPEWEYEAQNADALSVIQPWGKSILEAHYVWNGQPITMRCNRLALTVQNDYLDGYDAVRCIVTPVGGGGPQFLNGHPHHYYEVRRIDQLEKFVHEYATGYLKHWHGIDMQKYSLLQLKFAGDAMLRGYRVGMEAPKIPESLQ